MEGKPTNQVFPSCGSTSSEKNQAEQSAGNAIATATRGLKGRNAFCVLCLGLGFGFLGYLLSFAYVPCQGSSLKLRVIMCFPVGKP